MGERNRVRSGSTWSRLLALAVAIVGLSALSAGAASAQEDAPQNVQGRVQNRFLEDGERVTEPVPDVTITVETPDGEVVGEAVTDAEGQYRIGVPEPGSYVVVLHTDTLPEGLTVEEGQNTQAVELSGNQNVTRVFFLGEDTRQTERKLSLLPQTIANGLKLAMIIAITSIGLSLIFGTTGLSNFAHGELVTFGAFMAWIFNADVGLHVIGATLVGMAFTALLGATMERGLWRPLRRHNTSLTSMMVVSIGLALAARYLYLYIWGGDLKSYQNYMLQTDPVSLGPVDFPPRTLFVMAIAVGVIVTVALFLIKARFGKAIRAVSDNPSLASSSGIDTDRVILVVWIMGGALAGLGGVLYGLEYGIRWDMGFTLLLLMFAAITLGGLGNPFGALVGSLVIGVFVELWTWIVPNANDLKTVGALFALILVLLVRPQGLLGTKERIG
jgi:neutral amino acid transport system permease protein